MNSILEERSGNKCELCNGTESLTAHLVVPRKEELPDNQAVLCGECLGQITESSPLVVNHWHCLNESIWSEVEAVKVLAYRVLGRLSDQGWAVDLKNMMYMEEATQEWADHQADAVIVHKDSNGNVLEAGDTVTLIQDLNVKGSSLIAKRGTSVRRIRLVHDNAEHIEGKVEGQQIVILTKFVKKI